MKWPLILFGYSLLGVALLMEVSRTRVRYPDLPSMEHADHSEFVIKDDKVKVELSLNGTWQNSDLSEPIIKNGLLGLYRLNYEKNPNTVMVLFLKPYSGDLSLDEVVEDHLKEIPTDAILWKDHPAKTRDSKLPESNTDVRVVAYRANAGKSALKNMNVVYTYRVHGQIYRIDIISSLLIEMQEDWYERYANDLKELLKEVTFEVDEEIMQI